MGYGEADKLEMVRRAIFQKGPDMMSENSKFDYNFVLALIRQ